MKYREDNKIRRPDFLQILIDMKNIEKSLTIDQIVSKNLKVYIHKYSTSFRLQVAQVFLFFVAGFDTSSSAMMFMLYELARHPEIQDKLRNEINEVLKKDDDKITYENIKEITYLQQVFDGKFLLVLWLLLICCI